MNAVSLNTKRTAIIAGIATAALVAAISVGAVLTSGSSDTASAHHGTNQATTCQRWIAAGNTYTYDATRLVASRQQVINDADSGISPVLRSDMLFYVNHAQDPDHSQQDTAFRLADSIVNICALNR